MQHYRENVQIISQERITADLYQIWFESKQIAEASVPGQFITVYCKDGSRLLPRPFGISQINREKGQVCFVYKIIGKGTKEFSTYQAGEMLEVMGPLGNGFTIKNKSALLVGGGTGVPILVELAKEVEKVMAKKPVIVVGYRDETFLTEELSRYGNLVIATEDGSLGTRGNVIDAIKAGDIQTEIIYACGPHPMLRALQEYVGNANVELQISLEEKMACGIGACLACTCKTKEMDSYTKVHNKRICKDGPVFDAKEVIL